MSAKVAAVLLMLATYVFAFLHGRWYEKSFGREQISNYRQRRRIALSRRARRSQYFN